jgi:hypothetical protein
MDRSTIRTDRSTSRLRRVGRLARRRMRIDGDTLRNGTHTDGTLTVEISGLGSPVAGVPDSFEWEADRPVALMIVRSGIDGEDVAFHVGPARFGMGQGAGVGDGTGIRYVAFCYDAAPAPVAVPATPPMVGAAPVAATVPPSAQRRVAAGRSFLPTARERRSILSSILARPRPATA